MLRLKNVQFQLHLTLSYRLLILTSLSKYVPIPSYDIKNHHGAYHIRDTSLGIQPVSTFKVINKVYY